MVEESISRIFRESEDGADPLINVFSWFDEWEQGLCARAANYVREGDGRPVLAALPAAKPQIVWHREYLKKMEQQRVQTIRQAPLMLFVGFFGGKPAQLVRYVEVLSAALSIKPGRSKYATWIADETPDNVGNLIQFISNLDRLAIEYSESFPDEPIATSFDDALKAIELLGGSSADLISRVIPSRSHSGQIEFKLRGTTATKFLSTLPAAEFMRSLERRQARERAEVLKRLVAYPVAKDPAFLDFLIKSAASASAQVSAASRTLLELQPDDEVSAKAIPLLDASTAKARASAAQILGRIGSESALNAMRTRAKIEKSQDVLATINHLVTTSAAQVSEAPDGYYLAADGSCVEIPEFESLFETNEAPFSSDDLAQFKMLDEKYYKYQVSEYHRRLNDFKAGAHWIRNEPIKPDQARVGERLFTLLNSPIDLTAYVEDTNRRNYRGFGYKICPHFLRQYTRKLTSRLPDLRTVHLALIATGGARSAVSFLYDPFSDQLIKRIMEGAIDIRQVLQAAKDAGISAGYSNVTSQSYAANEAGFLSLVLDGSELVKRFVILPRTWPVTASQIGQVLNALPPQTLKVESNLNALQLLKQLPKFPMAAIDTVLYAALDERRQVHEAAQALLVNVENIAERVIAALTDNRQAVRARAARFLADRGVKNAVPAITKRLRTEKSEGARAEMISAVARLGGDTSPYLGRASLVKEAQALVKKLPNAKIDWLQMETSPVLKWVDGKRVDPVLPDAWLRLALKLKSSAESPLFRLYFQQMTPESVTEYSDWVLNSWIAYDTWRPASDEQRKKAVKQAEAYKATNDRYWSSLPIDEIVARLLYSWSTNYDNSGTEAKGILALAHHATPAKSANTISAYLKNHGKRVSQAKCLVEVLAAMGTPEALQVLVATATRFRQRTVRELAASCISTIAEDRGWSEDELADRSIPTGGIEEDGILNLMVGEQAKSYTARLGSDLSVKLFNPDSKEIKAIPAGQDENTKESRKLLSAAKKTIKTVVAQQSTRLYDGMVGARQWTVASWETDIVGHPIMVRLIERVIWRALAEDDSVVAVFRPTPEGDRLTADGDDADLSRATTIDIAHTTTVDENVRKAWLSHMEDFEVTPLFAQLSRPMRVLDNKEAKLTTIEDRKGWLTEAFKLRSATGKAGFERGPVEDGAGFDIYVKTFRNAGVRAELNFTGSYLPEENIPVSIIGLRFFNAKQELDSWRPTPLELSSVPPMVLFEAWNDLHEIASVGAFDENWQKKGLY